MWAALGKEILQPQAQTSINKSLQYTPELQCLARPVQLGGNVIFPPYEILLAFCYFITNFLCDKHPAPGTRKTEGFRPTL